MDTKSKILILQAELQLSAQEQSLKSIELEVMKLEDRIHQYDETRESLKKEIERSKENIRKLTPKQ